MKKGAALKTASVLDDPSAAQLYLQRPTQVARRSRLEDTRLERRGRLDLESAPTTVMPPQTKPPVKRRATQTAKHTKVPSDFDIEPIDSALLGIESNTKVERPQDSVWASAVTRTMATVWREVSSAQAAFDSEEATSTATASLVPLPTSAHAVLSTDTTLAAPAAACAPTSRGTRWRGRARGRLAPFLCALMLWLVDEPMVDGSVAMGAHTAVTAERLAREALTQLRQAEGRARWLVRLTERARANAR